MRRVERSVLGVRSAVHAHRRRRWRRDADGAQRRVRRLTARSPLSGARYWRVCKAAYRTGSPLAVRSCRRAPRTAGSKLCGVARGRVAARRERARERERGPLAVPSLSLLVGRCPAPVTAMSARPRRGSWARRHSRWCLVATRRDQL